MKFHGKGIALSAAALNTASRKLNADLPALWAVMTIETRGCGFLADRRPVILFERHIFHGRTNGRFDNVDPDISNAKAGGYGPGGAAQYERLARAMKLDRRPALESTSWGLGQIMGFNANLAGYAGVETMVRAMVKSEDAQFRGMVTFIKKTGLADFLKRKDWKGFAFRYNGTEFQKNRYDTRLAQAYARYVVGPSPDLAARTAQLYLTYLGYAPGGVDGWFGRNTQKALMRFQADHGVAVTGVLDDRSLSMLKKVALA